MNAASEYDVIVLGTGIAGLAAALAAREKGMRPAFILRWSIVGCCLLRSAVVDLDVTKNHLRSQRGASLHRSMEQICGRRPRA